MSQTDSDSDGDKDSSGGGGSDSGGSGSGGSGSGGSGSLPSNYDYNSWSFPQIIQMITGQDLPDLASLIVNDRGDGTPWWNFVGNSVAEASYNALGKRYYGANRNPGARVDFNNAANQINEVIKDLVYEGRSGQFDLASLAALRDQINMLSLWLTNARDQFGKYSAALNGKDSPFEGKAAEVILVQMKQYEHELQHWLDEVGGFGSGAFNKAPGKMVAQLVNTAYTTVVHIANVWFDIFRRIYDGLFSMIEAVWANIYNWTLENGLFLGSDQYILEIKWKEGRHSSKSINEHTIKKDATRWVDAYIKSVLQAVPVLFPGDINGSHHGVIAGDGTEERSYSKKYTERPSLVVDITSATGWKSINDAINTWLRGGLDALDKAGREAIEPYRVDLDAATASLRALTAPGDDNSTTGPGPGSDIGPGPGKIKIKVPKFEPGPGNIKIKVPKFEPGPGNIKMPKFEPGPGKIEPGPGTSDIPTFGPGTGPGAADSPYLDFGPGLGSAFGPGTGANVEFGPGTPGPGLVPSLTDGPSLGPGLGFGPGSGGTGPGPGLAFGPGTGGNRGRFGEALNPDGTPKLGKYNELLKPDGTSLTGPNGEIYDENGLPITDANGRPIGSDGKPIIGGSTDYKPTPIPDFESNYTPTPVPDGGGSGNHDFQYHPFDGGHGPGASAFDPGTAASGPGAFGPGSGNAADPGPSLPEFDPNGDFSPGTPGFQALQNGDTGYGSQPLPGGQDGGGEAVNGIPMPPPMGPGNRGGRDRERQTWLNEDESVWGTHNTRETAIIGRSNGDDDFEVEPDDDFAVPRRPGRFGARTPAPAPAVADEAADQQARELSE